jgi:hypothetical protein
MTAGFIMASISMVYASVLQHYIYTSPPNSIHVWIQAPAYILVAFSEAFVIITGLELAYTKAPTRYVSHQYLHTRLRLLTLWIEACGPWYRPCFGSRSASQLQYVSRLRPCLKTHTLFGCMLLSVSSGLSPGAGSTFASETPLTMYQSLRDRKQRTSSLMSQVWLSMVASLPSKKTDGESDGSRIGMPFECDTPRFDSFTNSSFNTSVSDHLFKSDCCNFVVNTLSSPFQKMLSMRKSEKRRTSSDFDCSLMVLRARSRET